MHLHANAKEEVMRKSVILAAKRTPTGSFGGALKDVSSVLLGKYAAKAALEESGVDVADVDELLMGQVLPAGQGQGVARQIALGAGLPIGTPASQINMVCGSGMKTVMQADIDIRAGEGDLYVAMGTESMSQSPFLMPYKVRSGIKMGSIEFEDHMLKDALMDPFDEVHMGITAENIAAKYKVTREAQDQFAITSQERAIAAIDSGVFKDEIVPVETTVRRQTVIVDTDEHPNRQTSLEKLAKLRPAFKKDGSVTAGNASGLNDGASAVVVASDDYAKAKGLKPLVEIVAIGQGGVEPSLMGMGPVPAIKQALERANMKLDDMDLIELNEAFAAQSLGVLTQLSEDHGVSVDDLLKKTNIHGGAIALGHPLGASGNRILVTLIHQMKKQKATYGLASLCIGGGMGTCVIVKNIE